jgi:4-cresol dehydrogenase (hydroxylating)
MMVDAAIAGWRAALGGAAVSADAPALTAFQLNTSEFRKRNVIAILRPASVHQVCEVIAVARSTGVPVHPISTGRNWGFGSALPARDPAAVVDLGRMNAIIGVSRQFRYAVIEPGVTQGQLADHLATLGGALALNVTGAGRDTSIVGNVLDNGGGNRGARIDDLLGAEAVLGNGEVVRTGLWHLRDGGDPVHCYPPGLGPDLRGLFVQSALGIVTKMVVRLHPAGPFLELTAEVAEPQLGELIDALRLARDDGLITGYARVSDATDPNIRFFRHTGRGRWTAQITVRGTSAIRREASRELKRRLKGVARRVVTFDTGHDLPTKAADGDRALLEARVSLQNGIPSDRSLEAIAQAAGKTFTGGSSPLLDRDKDLAGFLCVNVALPFTGAHAVECAATVDATAAELAVTTSRQFGVISATALSGFFPFYFNRRDQRDVTRAHRFKDELLRRLERTSIYPMRLDIDSIGPFIARTDDGYWRTLAAIEQALDPDGIISGRYSPAAARTPAREDAS